MKIQVQISWVGQSTKQFLTWLSFLCSANPPFLGMLQCKIEENLKKVTLENEILSALPPYFVAKSLAKWGTFEFDLATLLTPSSLITIWLHKSRQSCWEVRRLVHFIIWKKRIKTFVWNPFHTLLPNLSQSGRHLNLFWHPSLTPSFQGRRG